MTAMAEHYKYALDILPKKPSYIAYTVLQEELTSGIAKMLSDETGVDVLRYCSDDISDESRDYYFLIDGYGVEEQLSENDYEKLQEAVGGDIEEYYEYTSFLVRRWLGLQATPHSWIHVQGYYDSPYVDIQVGVPVL